MTSRTSSSIAWLYWPLWFPNYRLYVLSFVLYKLCHLIHPLRAPANSPYRVTGWECLCLQYQKSSTRPNDGRAGFAIHFANKQKRRWIDFCYLFFLPVSLRTVSPQPPPLRPSSVCFISCCTFPLCQLTRDYPSLYESPWVSTTVHSY